VPEIGKPEQPTGPVAAPGLISQTVKAISQSYNVVRKTLQAPVVNQTVNTVSTIGLAVGGAGLVSSFVFLPLNLNELFWLLMRLWAALLNVLGIKKRAKPWGVVYDSVTKQPLDPAYVVLKDQQGKEIGSCITDLDGCYGFLVEPGQYYLMAQKTHYQFPSQRLKNQTQDELYDHLYFGQKIEIKRLNEVIIQNIPLDPIKFDWNEFAKKSKGLLTFYSRFDLWFRRFLDLFFVIGFILAFLALIFVPHPFNIIIFGLYIVVFILRKLGLRPRAYGSIVEKATGQPLSFAIIKVFQADIKKQLFQRVADKYGRYYLLVPKGNYYLVIEKKQPDGSYQPIATTPIIYAKQGIIKQRWVV
jgi:hypothetical protein